MALAIVAVILAVSGGFRATVGGFRISARSPLASTIAALIAGGAWFVLARNSRSTTGDLEAAWHVLERNATRIIGSIALVAAIVASVFATRSAAGADASGYLSQAAMWSAGDSAYFELHAEFAQRDAWLATPLGWRPIDSPELDMAAIQVPTYPPGLPLLMAVPHALGGIDGANAIVVAGSAAAVWAAAMIVGGTAGVLAALLLAFSPVFLYQSFQPMSDVPVTAAWMLGFLLLRNSWSVSSGIACAIAILIRPNLAPLAIVPFVIAPRRAAFAMPILAAGAFIAFVQFDWYGSPLRSGYGSAEELFSISNIVPNAGRYASWLVATSPVLFFAPLGFARVRKDPLARALMIFAALVIAAYLIYAVFDHWSYLRFLLPAMAAFAVFAGIEIVAGISRWPVAWRLPMFLVVALGISAYGLFVARSLETFKLADQFRRVEQVAVFINEQLPRESVIVAGEQSGSMRYYTGQSILRWEAATPDAMRAAIGVLEKAGRPVYIVLDAFENDLFITKFRTVPEIVIGWPPMVDAGTTHRTRLWRLADRERFLAGEHINTVRLP